MRIGRGINMKKILVGFIMDGKSGGIDKYLLNFLEKVSGEDVRLDFLTNEIDPELEKKLKTYHSRIFAIQNLKHPRTQYRQVKAIIKKGNYDAVYLNISTAIDCIAVIAAKHMGVNRIMLHSHSSGNDCESTLKRSVFDFIHKCCRLFLYRYGTEFYACSVKAGEWLFPKKIVDSDKFQVIHNAVDREKFEYSVEKRKKIREELGIKDQFVLGHVGNFCYQKNHYFLIEIFEEIHKRDPEAVLLLAGDGVRFEQVRQIVSQKGMEESVKLLGRRSDADCLYQGMDAFILPSNFEGLPIAGIEAQSAGLPCFMSDTITRESKITKNCYFISLQSSVSDWAEEIIKRKQDRKPAEYLKNADQYDLSHQIEEMKRLVNL